MSDSATMPAAALRRTDLPKLSLGTKTAATLLAIVAAVVLPQLFHVIGAVSGQGTMLGVAFLPMHLPIIFVGLIAGPAVGAIAGAAAPLVSFLLSGMPMLAMLPLMMVELCAYGLVAGLLRGIKLPSLAKVVIAQLAGRGADRSHRDRRVRVRFQQGHRRHMDERPGRRPARSRAAVGADSARRLLDRVADRQAQPLI